MAPGDTWNIANDMAGLPAADSFFGGDGWVSCSFGANELRHEFRIRGRNPDDATARAFINAHSPYWFAYAIAKHESTIPGGGFPGERYHQFDLRKTAHGEDFLYAPILGRPNGWGLFQIDLDDPNCVDKQVLWNWRANMLKGEEKMEMTQVVADDWLNCMGPRYTSRGGCKTRPSGKCEVNVAGDNFPHGQKVQNQIFKYIAANPGATTGTVYGTDPARCIVGSTGKWLVPSTTIPKADVIPDETDANCLFSESDPMRDGTPQDSVAIQCYNGCTIHHVTWNGGMWNFNPNSMNYVHKVCLEVDP